MVDRVVGKSDPRIAASAAQSPPLVQSLERLESALARRPRAGGCLPWSRGPDPELVAAVRALTERVAPLLGKAASPLRQRVYDVLLRLKEHPDCGGRVLMVAARDLVMAVCKSDLELAADLAGHLAHPEHQSADVLDKQRKIINQISVDSPSLGAQQRAHAMLTRPHVRTGGNRGPRLPAVPAQIRVRVSAMPGATGVASRRKMAPAERALVRAEVEGRPIADINDVGAALLSERSLTSKWLQSDTGHIYHVANSFTKGAFGKGRRALNQDGEPCFIKEVRLYVPERIKADRSKAGPHGQGRKVLATRFTPEATWNNELEILEVAGARFKPVDTFQVDGKAYAVFPALDGSLGDIYKKSATPEERRALAHHVGIEVARDQQRAHAAGVLHRDVKPDNILVGRDGTMGLSDYGLAVRLPPGENVLYSRAGRGRHSGTLDYAAPEVTLAGEPQKASDVYSLGCVILRVLAGRGAAHLFAGMRHPRPDPGLAPEHLWQQRHQSWESDFHEVTTLREDGTWPADLLPDTKIYKNFPQVQRAFAVDPELTEYVVCFMLNPQPEQRPTAQQVVDAFTAVPDRDALAKLAREQMSEHLQPSDVQRGTYVWLQAQRALTRIDKA